MELEESKQKETPKVETKLETVFEKVKERKNSRVGPKSGLDTDKLIKNMRQSYERKTIERPQSGRLILGKQVSETSITRFQPQSSRHRQDI